MSRRSEAKETKIAKRAAKQAELSRSCGTCTACCTAKGVKELQKPDGVKCVHLLEGVKGCSVYAQRPESCQDWSCLWRLGGFEGAERPDRLGVVVDMTAIDYEVWPDGQAFTLREAFPGGFEKAGLFIGRLSSKSVLVLIREDRTRTILGPPEKVAQVRENSSKFLPMTSGLV